MDTFTSQYLKSSNILLDNGFYRQAINLAWIALRHEIFKWLKLKGLSYNSSREALLKTIIYFQSENISSDICELDTISILSEWDNHYEVNHKNALRFYTKCYSIIKKISQS